MKWAFLRFSGELLILGRSFLALVVSWAERSAHEASDYKGINIKSDDLTWSDRRHDLDPRFRNLQLEEKRKERKRVWEEERLEMSQNDRTDGRMDRWWMDGESLPFMFSSVSGFCLTEIPPLTRVWRCLHVRLSDLWWISGGRKNKPEQQQQQQPSGQHITELLIASLNCLPFSVCVDQKSNFQHPHLTNEENIFTEVLDRVVFKLQCSGVFSGCTNNTRGYISVCGSLTHCLLPRNRLGPGKRSAVSHTHTHTFNTATDQSSVAQSLLL